MIKRNTLLNQFEQKRIIDPGDFPKVILIDTVSFCNLKCSMCVHKEMTRAKGVMKWSIFKKIIDEIALVKKDTRVWLVFFGEALILKRRKPSIFDLIAYAKGMGLTDVVLNSNATLLDEDAVKGLIDSKLDAIYIGLDAFTSETYSKLRVGGNYNKTMSNVINLLNFKKSENIKKPEVYVQFVEMDINKKEKDDFIKFWSDQGAIVKIRPKVSWAGMIDAPNQTIEREDRMPCHWAMQTLSIINTGKTVLCAVDLDARFIAGDVTRQSIKDIWNGRLKELRELHLSRQFTLLPDICMKCKDWQSARADYYKQDT